MIELRGIDREVNLMESIDKKADFYYKKYRPYVKELMDHSLLKKFKRIDSFDVWALGEMLRKTDEMISICEANGTVADLGVLPRIAKDVVTITYGTSPISLIATVQPLEEEVGLIYYKTVVAMNSQGNITAGDRIASSLGDWKTPIGYSSAETTETIGNGDGSTTTFSATLAYRPIRPGTVIVRAGNAVGSDINQDGTIVGAGIREGIINYETGAISITFNTAPESGVFVNCTYFGNIETLTLGVKEINYELVTKQVRAKIFALKGVTGLFKAYSMQKRFGVAAEEELAIDLVNTLNAEILGTMIRNLNNAVLPNAVVTWNDTPQGGVSYFEHKQGIKDAMAGVEKKIIQNAKKGAISYIIAGSGVARVLRTLFGWETLYDGHGMATAHLFGKLDGIPVVRVSDDNVLPSNVAIIGYKGPTGFEAPIAFCPYMPVTVTAVLPTPHPLVSQRAVACWAGIEVLVERFLGKLVLTGESF